MSCSLRCVRNSILLRPLYSLCLCGSILLALVGCQPAPSSNLLPTPIPFPTVTPGRLVRGPLPTIVGLPLDGSNLANPATAIAIMSQPTATPDYTACPAAVSLDVPPRPTTTQESAAAILAYLNAGGQPNALASAWELSSDSFRADVDFTGEGVPETVFSLQSDDGGQMLVFGCENGQIVSLFGAAAADTAPQIIAIGDMNADTRPDILFAAQVCSPDAPNDCVYRTDLRAFSPPEGRFVGLLSSTLASLEPPTIRDVDDDRVQEIVVRLTDDGTAATGPLRTGVNIYDWNGTFYVLSIIQLDPPAFRIQYVQEADRAFARQQFDQAASLYERAVTDPALRFWLNDEPAWLTAYVSYRLVLAFAYTEDERLLPTFQAATAAYPDPNNAPVYVTMTNTFWNALQVTNNLNSACREVQAIIAARPEAVSLLNRYGSRSPVYAAQELCPF